MTDRKTHDDGGREARTAAPLQPPRVGGEPLVLDDDSPAGDGTLRDALARQSERFAPEPEPTAALVSSDPTAMSAGALGAGPDAAAPSNSTGRTRIGDRIFSTLSSGSAWVVIAIVVLVAVFLVKSSIGALSNDNVNFLTSTEWSLTPGNLRFGVANLLWVTVIIALIAMVLAVPVAIGIALFITQYAPRRLAQPVAYVIDLLAAIPSIVYGIWGYTTLASALTPVQHLLYHLSGIGIFDDHGKDTRTIFDGGVVLAVMVLPIITAISRDVFARTPRANIEAALALGATKWEMIRMAVLPYGRPGLVSGSMLGLGRALGETIAVYLILSTTSTFSFSIFDGGETIASRIANGASEFNNPQSTGAYVAAGLVLFVLTFVVNAAARAIVNRRKDFR